MAIEYYIPRGCMTLGKIESGGLLGAGKEYHITDATLDITEETIEVFNTCGPIAVKDLKVAGQRTVMLNATINGTENPNLMELWSFAVGGGVTKYETPETFTDLPFPTVAVGEKTPVPGGYSNLESLTIKDSTGSPVTLTLNTHYTVDLKKGLVTWLDVTSSSVAQPFLASGAGATADYDVVSVGTVSEVERYAVIHGINIANANKAMNTMLYRVSIKPTSAPLKTEANEAASFSFEMEALLADNAPLSGTHGSIGRTVIAR